MSNLNKRLAQACGERNCDFGRRVDGLCRCLCWHHLWRIRSQPRRHVHTMQADDENGANLADVWIDNRSALWTPEEVNAFCAALETAWGSSSVSKSLDSCEGRTITQGAMFHTNDTGQHIINSLWHGIPDGANADRVWMHEGRAKAGPPWLPMRLSSMLTSQAVLATR